MVLSHPLGWDATAGTYWRWRSRDNNSDDVAAINNGVHEVNAYLMGWDDLGGNWDRIRVNPGGSLIIETPITSATTNGNTVVI